MKNHIKSILCAFFLGCWLLLPGLVLAQNIPTNSTNSTQNNASQSGLLNRLQNVAKEGGFQTNTDIASTPKIVGTVVGAFLGFLGLTFLVLMIIAGYGWMTAQGNEEQVSKSKKTISQAVIGVVVAASAWTIWNFVFQRFILLN